MLASVVVGGARLSTVEGGRAASPRVVTGQRSEEVAQEEVEHYLERPRVSSAELVATVPAAPTVASKSAGPVIALIASTAAAAAPDADGVRVQEEVVHGLAELEAAVRPEACREGRGRRREEGVGERAVHEGQVVR